MADQTKPKPTLALFYHRENPNSTDYLTVTLSVVQIETDDAGARHIRNLNYRADIDDLQITAQANRIARDNDDSTYYGLATEFHPNSVDLYRAQSMVATLRRIDTALSRAAARNGYPADLADYAGRVARAIGATAIVYPASRGGWSYDDNEHCILPLGEGISWLRQHLAAQLRRFRAGEALAA